MYHRDQVIRTHAQQPAGGRVSDPADFPPDSDIAAGMWTSWRRGGRQGEAIGIYAARMLEIPLPWTKMRAVYALIGW